MMMNTAIAIGAFLCAIGLAVLCQISAISPDPGVMMMLSKEMFTENCGGRACNLYTHYCDIALDKCLHCAELCIPAVIKSDPEAMHFCVTTCPLYMDELYLSAPGMPNCTTKATAGDEQDTLSWFLPVIIVVTTTLSTALLLSLIGNLYLLLNKRKEPVSKVHQHLHYNELNQRDQGIGGVKDDKALVPMESRFTQTLEPAPIQSRPQSSDNIEIISRDETEIVKAEPSLGAPNAVACSGIPGPFALQTASEERYHTEDGGSNQTSVKEIVTEEDGSNKTSVKETVGGQEKALEWEVQKWNPLA